MKKYAMLAVFALCAAVLSIAQTKGDILIGTSTEVGGPVNIQSFDASGINGAVNSGGIGVYKLKYDVDGEKEDYANVTIFNLSPRVGYFFTNSFVGGLKVNIFSSSADFEWDNEKVTSTGFSGGPFARHYFGEGNVKPYVELEAIFGTMKVDGGEYEDTMNSIRYGGGAGVAIIVNNYITFDILAGYSNTTFKNEDDDDFKEIVSGFGLGLGLTMLIGSGF